MFPLLLLLATPFLNTQQASTQCVDKGEMPAVTETQPVPGPSGATAVLKVSTADDHSKNSHDCNADYQLAVTPAPGKAPVVADFLAADGDSGRALNLRLDGFSQDGKHVFGTLVERGKYTTMLLFDVEVATGGAQLVDLKQQFGRELSMCSSPQFGVAGTSQTGEVIVEVSANGACAASGRWILDRASGKPRRIAPGATIIGLYESGG